MTGHHKYNVEDIRLYLEGKLTPQQMHDLEMAALNDPFLADAIEGMSQHGNNEQFANDVQELNARLNERVRKKRIVPITVNNLWWKVAAVLLIVITGVAVIILTGENNKIDNVGIAKTENKKEAAALPDSVAGDITAFSQAAADSPTTTSVKENENAPSTKRQAQPTPSKPTVKKETVTNLEEVSSSRPSENLDHQQRVLQPDSVVKVEGVATQKAESNAEITKVLQGKAAGVDVQANEVDDSVYDEVVIVGSGNRSNRSRAFAADRIKRRIIPGKGWDDFEQYILDSTNITTADSIFKGEEQVTFTIGDDGLPESIKILRSVSPAHDKEAIRLLRNGPSWKVIEGKKRKLTLRIIF